MTSGLPGEDYSFANPIVLRQRSRKLAKYAGCDIKKVNEATINELISKTF